MIKTTYQKPEIRDANDNIIQQGAFGKNTALANSTNDGWIDYVANDLEFLYDLAKDEIVPVPSLPASGQTNKTYLLTTTGVSYRWSSTQWVEISSSEAVGRAETAATNAQNYANAAQQSADDAQDTADDISEHLAQIDRNTGGVSKNSKRISNVEKLLQGNLYDYDTDDDVAYTKTVPAGAMPYAGIEKIGGKTLVWNQLSNNDYASSEPSGLTFTNNGDGSWTVNGEATAKTNKPLCRVPIVNGHKYYYCGCPAGGSTTTYWLSVSAVSAFGVDTGNGNIFASNVDAIYNIRFDFNAGAILDNVTFYPQIFDLTLIFGSGNEPTTVEEFKAMFPADYYPYNEGELLSAGVTEVESEGVNLIDDGGLANWTATGSITFPCHLKKGVTYTVATFNNSNDGGSCVFYDADNSTQFFAVTWSGLRATGKQITPSADMTSIRIYSNIATTKNIMIVRGNTKPTTFVSYMQPKQYPIPAEVQALEGYGWSAGTAYNYIDYERKVFVQNVGRVDLGTLNWSYTNESGHLRFYGAIPDIKIQMTPSEIGNLIISRYVTESSNAVYANTYNKSCAVHYTVHAIWVYDSSYTDVTAFKSAMNGVYAYYELATPIETDISAYLSDDNLIEVEAGGTLTFPNSNGDDYRITVPSEETYMINLQEAVSNG